MKTPLHYQLSEYDCGPTSLMNAISFLFEREEIPPEVLRNIMLYSLDCYSPEGTPGKHGTSRTAMMFLAHWLDGFGKAGQLNISCSYLRASSVYLGADSRLRDALRQHGAAVVRLFYDEDHYVLLTGLEDDAVLMFDPYYQTEPFPQADIEMIADQPFRYNRRVPITYLNQTTRSLYALGPTEEREAVLLFNGQTRLTPETTIEYFI